MDEAAEDPTNACSVDANVLTVQEASCLSSMSEGVDLMYICRMPGCMFFGLNSQWVKHKDKYHFKCPLCGEQYRPSADYKGSVKAAMLLQIVDPVTNELSRIPTNWPPSEEINWDNQFSVQGTCFRMHVFKTCVVKCVSCNV